MAVLKLRVLLRPAESLLRAGCVLAASMLRECGRADAPRAVRDPRFGLSTPRSATASSQTDQLDHWDCWGRELLRAAIRLGVQTRLLGWDHAVLPRW